MAGDVRVESQKLVASGEVMKSQRDRIQGLLDDAKATVTGLSSWEGDAKQNFESGFNGMSAQFDEAYNLITEYVNFLNNAAEEYSKAEAERAEDNATFENN